MPYLALVAGLVDVELFYLTCHELSDSFWMMGRGPWQDRTKRGKSTITGRSIRDSHPIEVLSEQMCIAQCFTPP